MQRSDRDALDNHLKGILRPFLWSIGAVYASLSLSWLAGFRANVPGYVVLMWVGTAAVCLVLGALARPALPARYAHPFVLLVMACAMNNVLWLLTATQDFAYTAVFYLIMLAAAVFFLSMPYTTVVVGISVVGWSVVAFTSNEADVLVRWGYTLYAAAVVALIAQHLQVRTYRNLEELRRSDAERFQREAELKRLKQQQEDRAKLLNLTAHQVASPLTPILLRLRELRKHDGRRQPQEQAAVDAIERNVRRLDMAMKDVVAAVGMPDQKLHRQLQDICALLREVQAESPESARIAIEAPAEFITTVDPWRLKTAFSRLLQAVVDCEPGTDPIRIELQHAPNRLLVRFRRPAAKLPPERAGQLFEPFVHTYDPVQRTAADIGLGLFIARGHIEAHGGDVWSQHDEGVTLACRLPLGQGPAAPT